MSARGLLIAAVSALTLGGLVLQARLAEATPGLALWAPLLLGFVAALGAACAGRHVERLLRGAGPWLFWGAACALLALLLVLGRRYRGGLYLPGRINPSELVKLCVVFSLAGLLPRSRGAAFAMLGSVCALVAAAGDFGLLAQLVLTATALLLAASWGWGLLACAAVGAGFAAAAACPFGHLATRFAVWRDPLADTTGAGWQTLQGLAAVASGGVGGVGFGLGDAQAVPIASSDFVYAVLAEDLGLVGGAGALALWGVVFACGLVAAERRAAEGARGEALLAVGIVASLAVQVILNVAGVLNALPMTGITLPLLSHGGSSLAVTLALCGILCGLLAPRADSAHE